MTQIAVTHVRYNLISGEKMKKILVTGGAGYLGAVLVPKLLRRGYRVRVLDLFLYGDDSLFPKEFIQTNQLELIKTDLRNRAEVKKSLNDIDAIIHLAGISNDPSSDLDPQLTKDVNITAVQHLIDDARQARIPRFINASSSSVYGIKEEPDVTEKLSLEPLTVYSESKVAIEDYLAKHRGQMTAVSVRSATICGYSPRLRLDLTVNILTYHGVTKNKITVFGGAQKRPNIHIDDIADFYLSMVDAPAELIDGEAFNVCGANHTVSALADLVKKTVAPQATIETVSTNDLRSYHVSAAKAEEVLEFKPKKTIEDAVRELSAAFKDGRIKNPEDDRYYNVRTMKKVLAGQSQIAKL
jgi:nucleoside-diphosphate-sugar epimerase